jgi:hypothetical protein
MKRICFGLAVLMISLVLAGCGSVGRNFDTARVKDIKNGATTKAEILEWFGLPFKEGVEGNQTMWTYQYDEYAVIGSEQSKDLVILFTPNNAVKAYRYASTGGK